MFLYFRKDAGLDSGHQHHVCSLKGGLAHLLLLLLLLGCSLYPPLLRQRRGVANVIHVEVTPVHRRHGLITEGSDGLTENKGGDSQFGQIVKVSLDALLQRLERGQYGCRPARHKHNQLGRHKILTPYESGDWEPTCSSVSVRAA